MAVSGGPKLPINGISFLVDFANTKSYNSGSVVVDLARANSTGSLRNGVQFNPQNGGTLTFDGINNYILMNDASTNVGLDMINVGAVGIWCWIKTTTTAPSTLIGTSGSALPAFSVRLNTPTTTETEYRQASTFNQIASRGTNFNVYDGKWHHIALFARFGILIIDGVSIPITPHNGGSFVSVLSVNLTIGALNNGGTIEQFANMELANIILYTSTFSEQDVITYYNSTRSRFGV